MYKAGLKPEALKERKRRVAEYMQKYRRIKPKPSTAAWVRENPLNALKYVYRRCRHSAKNRSIEFRFNCFEEFSLAIGGVIPESCPVLGIPLRIGDEKFCANSPSVDRLDSTRPYEAGNVFIISHRANMIKSLGTADDHEAIAKWMREQSEDVRPRVASAA